MYKEQIFQSDNELPVDLKWQILSFLRINYPEGFQAKNENRDWINNPEDKSIHIVITTENNILISYCAVVRKQLVHKDENYNIMGLTGVMTYPAFRGGGFGKRVVDIGTKIIKEHNPDIGMFHCKKDLKDFYIKSGWESMGTAITLIGNKETPDVSNELMMTIFLSEKAKKNKTDFETIPIYFGKDTL